MLLAVGILRETQRQLQQGMDGEMEPTSRISLDNKPAGAAPCSMGMPGSLLSLLLPGVFKPLYPFQVNLEAIWRLKRKVVWKRQNTSCRVPKRKPLRNTQSLFLKGFQEW